ncbi:MAG: NAD(P)-binding protein [Thiomicrospira sp.]|jgi:predicted NAD/FAD-binding protein|nr:NAD(P)-binding protein [Thiomicrospira sp.]
MTQTTPSQHIAVIGSGISGLSAAWFFGQHHQVTLFEKDTRLGGHTNTKLIQLDGKQTAVDTGFIVYNEPNYPLLTQLFAHLDVDTYPTDMSFGVSIDQGRIEYAGHNLNTLFAQRKRLLSWQHWHMLLEILRFNKQAKADLATGLNPNLTLGEYLGLHGFDETMQTLYLLPMAAAIWSCPTHTMLAFPANSFLQFFFNHGLLNINDRPQWRTVVGGAQTYIRRILATESFDVEHDAVTDVFPSHAVDAKVRVLTASGKSTLFDQVIFACHADEAYGLLRSGGFELLHHFRYQHNEAWLHTDANLMPKLKSAWSAWNYLSDLDALNTRSVAVTYWMNTLQPLNTQRDIFVTLNPVRPPAPDQVIEKIDYQHPVFNQAAINAQTQLHELQGYKNCWFAGAYCGYGFHEDGLASAVYLAKRWRLALPWEAQA